MKYINPGKKGLKTPWLMCPSINYTDQFFECRTETVRSAGTPPIYDMIFMYIRTHIHIYIYIPHVHNYTTSSNKNVLPIFWSLSTVYSCINPVRNKHRAHVCGVIIGCPSEIKAALPASLEVEHLLLYGALIPIWICLLCQFWFTYLILGGEMSAKLYAVQYLCIKIYQYCNKLT